MFVYRVVVTTLAAVIELSLMSVMAHEHDKNIRTGMFAYIAILLAAILGMWG